MQFRANDSLLRCCDDSDHRPQKATGSTFPPFELPARPRHAHRRELPSGGGRTNSTGGSFPPVAPPTPRPEGISLR